MVLSNIVLHQPIQLQLNQISRDFSTGWLRSKFALRNVTASISPGTVVGLLGPNGAGKSTLLRIVAGWLPPLSGEVRIDDRLLKSKACFVRRQVMLVSDRTAFRGSPIDFIASTVRDYQLDYVGLENRVTELFERLDLVACARQSMLTLSKGQQYKVCLACLLSVSPAIWLLDEPYSSGLDAAGIQCFEEAVEQHRRENGIAIFSSQWPQHAVRIADRALVLHQGELVYEGAPNTTVPNELTKSACPALHSVLSGLGSST